MAIIDVRDKWLVVNTTTCATVQTCSSRVSARIAASAFNRHERENGRGSVYSVGLNLNCEVFRELLQIAQDKGVDLSFLFISID